MRRCPAEVKLYAGGEDNFCHRLIGAQGQLTDFGSLDRRALAARKIATVLCEHPTVVAGHAFTTGQIKRSGVEKDSAEHHGGVRDQGRAWLRCH